jgi:hypothetical protein
MILMVVGRVSLATAADPAYYQKRDTWEETLRVSREPLGSFEETEETAAQTRRTADATTRNFQPLAAELNFGDTPQKIRTRVAGLKRLFVGTSRVRGGMSGVFGEPRLISADGHGVPWTQAQPRTSFRSAPGPGSQQRRLPLKGSRSPRASCFTNTRDSLNWAASSNGSRPGWPWSGARRGTPKRFSSIGVATGKSPIRPSRGANSSGIW